jgi:serine/threonine protein kinase
MDTNLTGQVLLNQFRVDSFIASGGMGAVYRVWDIKRNVPIAMKVLHTDLAEDPAVVKRFQREAQTLQNLAHPNIVPFYGLYQVSGISFLLERYVDGPTLKQILSQSPGRRLSVGEAMIYLKALCAALGYAHAYGVVHCDVKPGNVMTDQGGNIYLTDFGVARYISSTTTTLAGVGTPAYMAPEQIRSEPVSAATDVYMLGIMLYEMLTGRRPFSGDEVGTDQGGITPTDRVIYAQLNLTPLDPRNFAPDIPPALSQVILQAMTKDPAGRYRDMQSLFTDACNAAGIRPEDLPDRVKIPRTTISTSPHQVGSAQSQEILPPPRRGVAPWLLAGVGVAGVCGLVAIILGVVLLLTVTKPSSTKTPLAQSGSTPTRMITNTTRPPALTHTVTPTPEATSSATTDLALVRTAAALTVAAQLTGIAQNATSTVALPTETPTAPPPTETSTAPPPTETLTELPSTETPTETVVPPTSTDTPTPTPTSTQPPPPRLAYVVGPVGNSDVYAANSEGGEQLAIAAKNCDEAEPDWSPDGNSIVYQADCEGSYDLWVVGGFGGTPYRLTTSAVTDEREPDWSPDSSQVVFRQNPKGKERDVEGELIVINVNDLQSYSLGIWGRAPAWSPDGKRIAFMSTLSGHWQVYIYDVQSGAYNQLTDCSVNCRWPSWSPDGGYVAYNTTTGADSAVPNGVWYIPISGGSPVSLIADAGCGRPGWSTSHWVAFNSNNGIEIVQDDGTSRKVLISGGDNVWAPSWSR